MRQQIKNVICNVIYSRAANSFSLPFIYHGEIIILKYEKVKKKIRKNLQSQHFYMRPCGAKFLKRLIKGA
jgi:hypothetical protein